MSVATLAVDLDSAANRTVRVPRLAVRNRTLENGDATARPDTATTAGTGGSSEHGGQGSSGPSSLRAPSPGLQRRLSDQSGSGSSGLTRRTVVGERPSTASKPAEAGKKKKSGMLGFLTMKEPSATALEEFAEAQKKKEREKGNGVANMSSVSSRKLPEYVPKVNSKWDGLPENAKKQTNESRSIRSRGDSTATAGRRPSTLTSWSNRSDEGKRPIGSLSSRPPKSPGMPQRSTLQSRGTVSSTHSARAPIPNNDVHPAFRPIAVEETPENLPQTFLHPPSPPRQRQRQSPPRQLSPPGQQGAVQELPASFGAVPELDSGDGPLPELESSVVVQELDALRSRDATPVPKSPITPSLDVDDPPPTYYYSDSIASAYSGAGDTSTTFFYSQSDTDHEDFARPSAPKQLRQPINFSRRRTGKARPPSLGRLPETTASHPSGFTFLVPEEPPLLSPTLKNSDGRIDPFLTDTFAAHSRATGKIVERPGAPQHLPRPSVDDQPVRASTSTYVSSAADLQSPTFSTAATDSTRPSTAASQPQQPLCSDADADDDRHIHTIDDDDEDPDGPDPYYTYPSHHVAGRRGSEASTAPSLAPSAMSAQWTLTPKERLGLGGTIRKGEVLPWETVEDLRRDAAVVGGGGERGAAGGEVQSSLPTPTEGKFKRLSYRFGGKK